MARATVSFCDVVVMAESGTIVDPHVRVGIVAGDGGTVAWPLAIGPMRAKRLRRVIADVEEGRPETATRESPRDFVNRRMDELENGEAADDEKKP